MAIMEFIASEFSSYVVGKAIENIEDAVERKKREKELINKFDEFCINSRWRDVFENQGFKDSIDFTGLIKELRNSIVDNTYKYYHTIDVQSEDENYNNILEGLYQVARADAMSQKEQVQKFVYAAYEMILYYYIENLKPDTKLAIALSKRYTDEKITELEAQIIKQVQLNQKTIELLSSHPEPADGFCGRETELKDIEQKFACGNRIVVISGTGGMGKSELAKAYAKVHRQDYDKVCFTYYQGNIKQTVVSGLSWSYGNWIDLPVEDQFQMKISCIKSLSKPTLLIIDDVNELPDRDNLKNISGDYIHILITTRVNELIDTHPVIVDKLDYEQHLLPLFKYHTGISDESWPEWLMQNGNILKEIIQDLLLNHTMMVVLVAKLWHTSDLTLEQVRDCLLKSRLAPEIIEKVSNFKDTDRIEAGKVHIYDHLSGHVLNLFSLAGLEGDKNKISTLRNMSLIPYSGIKRSTFREWTGLEDLNDLNNLINSGWITLSEEQNEKRISMHAVISDAVYVQTQPTVENCNKLLNSILDESVSDCYMNPASKLYMVEYLRFALNRIQQEDKLTANLANILGSYLDFVADYSGSLEYYQKALAIREKVLGKEHPSTATIYNNIAGVFSHKGDYAKALEWHQKALAIREKVLGKEHPDTATTYNNIAGVYDSQGDYAKALEWYQKALIIHEKVQGKEHPDTAITYNNIADVFSHQGDYAKALEWYQKALAIREKVLGKEHPDTATTYNNIAVVYDSQGDYAKALEWYQKDLAISEKVLGKEHPDTATTYQNIAGVYDSQGDYVKALEWYQKALAIREKVQGKEHPDTATTYNNIALAYSHQRNCARALEWYQKALVILEKVLGKEHPDTATTYNNIALVYSNQGDYAKALEWYQKALAILEKVLGKEHPDTATAYYNIAVAYDSQGDYLNALEWRQKAIIILEKIFGSENNTVIEIYIRIAGLCENLREYTDALTFYQRELKVLINCERNEEIKYYISIISNNIASVYGHMDDYINALEYYQIALEIRKNMFGADDPITAMTYNDIGSVYNNLGNFGEAIKHFLIAHKVFSCEKGSDDPTTQMINKNLHRAYITNGGKETDFEAWLISKQA